MSYQSVNPFDGKWLASFEPPTDQELEAALATAATCFGTWRQNSFVERPAVARRAASILRERVDEFERIRATHDARAGQACADG